jgi:AcrR family transcriptional regulator
MARKVGSHGPTTLEAIREAGLELIYKHGYEAMSLRSLAAEVGIQAGSLYNHIKTKQDLLFDLMHTHMENLLSQMYKAMESGQEAEGRLRSFVKFHVEYHVSRKREVFISYSELRSLDPAYHRAIVRMRREYEGYLISILEQGAADHIFVVDDAPAAAYGIIAMLTSNLIWFRPGGRMTVADLVKFYTRMVLGAVGVVDKSPLAAVDVSPSLAVPAQVDEQARFRAHLAPYSAEDGGVV